MSGVSNMGSISVDPAFLVINECIAVTSAMRKNARWAQSGVSAILGTVSPENEDFNMASKLILKSNTNSMNMVCECVSLDLRFSY